MEENRCKYCGMVLPFNQFCCKSCFDSFEADVAYDDYDDDYEAYDDEEYDDWEE